MCSSDIRACCIRLHFRFAFQSSFVEKANRVSPVSELSSIRRETFRNSNHLSSIFNAKKLLLKGMKTSLGSTVSYLDRSCTNKKHTNSRAIRNKQINEMRYSRETVTIMATLTVVVLLASIISIECHIKRTQYHEQGLHGPKSYKFGYTSGDHKNPQERHEVSDGHGHVKGWYSFVDANGKHQVVHYEAHPKYGFRVHNYKSKAYNTGKRHYNS